MITHITPRRLGKRQAPTNLEPIPSLSAVNGASTNAPPSDSATALVLDTSSPPPFSTPTAAFTSSPSPPPSLSSDQSTISSTPTSVASSTSQIPIGTVVGSCVGALIGAVALIILGLWFYRRYSRSLKKNSRLRGRLSFARNRNAYAEQERSRSRLEPWNKLEDGDDKWEGMYQTKEVDNVAPMEKLTMFKKSPSVRTAYTHKSDEPLSFDLHAFAKYDPNLAEDLASKNTLDMPTPRPFLGRVDASPVISWDAESQRDGSYVSIRSGRVTGGAMSPTINMAIPTPAATSSQPHRWESAEVIHFDDAQPVDVADDKPFEEDKEKRRSIQNPFFNEQEYAQSQSQTRSRSNSASRPAPKSKKGKERAFSDDPFGEDMVLPRSFANHTVSESTSSVASNERAIQQLIAALDVSEEEVQERLRVASMQPSFISAASAYSAEDDDVTREFPLPPSIEGGRSDRQ